MGQFKIVEIDTGEVLKEIFDTGEEANKFAKKIKKGRWQPRPIRKNCWKNREREKQKRRPLPNYILTIHEHYAYQSKVNPEKVAFTPSDSWGEQNKQKALSVGKYLSQYFSERLSSYAIEEIVLRWKAERETGEGYKIAQDEKEIIRVYENCTFYSCMGNNSFGRSNGHPSRILAEGDLKLAYTEDSAGRVKARAILWPERKIYDCHKGDYFLKKLLEKDGYVEKIGGLEGAKVKRILLEKNTFVLLSMDGPTGYYQAEDKEEYLELAKRGEISWYMFGVGRTNANV